jgi:hypothetical protein
MPDSIKQLEEKAKNSPALPQYFRDLMLREIKEGTATADWAKRIIERVSFIEQFVGKR